MSNEYKPVVLGSDMEVFVNGQSVGKTVVINALISAAKNHVDIAPLKDVNVAITGTATMKLTPEAEKIIRKVISSSDIPHFPIGNTQSHTAISNHNPYQHRGGITKRGKTKYLRK